MSITWNIPKSFAQGDRIVWSEHLPDYDPSADILSCFIRGQSSLDLTGVHNDDYWDFVITSAQSAKLFSGKYKTQFKIFALSGEIKTLGSTDFTVLPSFENLPELEARSADEIELEAITQAIAKLASGAVSEYEIGDRRMRYQDLDKLTKRQEYLRRRIAIGQGRVSPGGRNVGTGFFS